MHLCASFINLLHTGAVANRDIMSVLKFYLFNNAILYVLRWVISLFYIFNWNIFCRLFNNMASVLEGIKYVADDNLKESVEDKNVYTGKDKDKK